MEKSIYGVKCIFTFDRLRKNEKDYVYEERTIVLKAFDFEKAISLAEADAQKYAEDEKGKYLGFADAYLAKEADIFFEGVHEVYSIMRHDDSEPEDYLDYYYDTGGECTGDVSDD